MKSEVQQIWDLLRSMTVGVLMFDRDENLIIANPVMRTITGVYREDATFKDFMGALKKELALRNRERDEPVDLLSASRDAIREGKNKSFNEVPFRRKFFEIVITPVRDSERNITGGAFIFHDVTRIKEIDDLKTEFVTVASHQLRTPLTAMKLYIEMLLDGSVGELGAKQKEYVESVSTSTERMITLVNDLLNISRIETRRLKIDPVPTDLAAFLQELVRDSSLVAESKHCRVQCHVPDEACDPVPVDQKLLRQVVMNLITNAIRYSNESTCEITVGLRERSRKNIVLYVKDNGIGIPDDVQDRIFERFFRAKNAVSTQAEGTGMGLYIAKMVIEDAGGRIWFDSAVGKGSTFYVMIPKEGMRRRAGEKELLGR